MHLHWVSASEWALPDERIFVVEPVWTEVARHAPSALGDTRLTRIAAPTEVDARLEPFRLDAAEAAAITFALLQPDAILLCDELAGRQACSALGLRFAGSVGLIIHAVGARRVSVERAVQALSELPGRGRLHASQDLIAEAIDAVRRVVVQ